MTPLVLPALMLKAKTDYGVQDYSRSIRSSVHALWADSIEYFAFVDSMVLAIHRGLTRAWYEGAREYGILPDELTMEERSALSNEINNNIGAVMSFADVVAGSKRADGNPLAPLYKRAQMWSNRYEATRSMARAYAARDQKLAWRLGSCREHCSTCLMLSNRIYRGSIWRKYNIYPRMKSLACRGYRCCCRLEATTDPCTPGRPPDI